MRLEIAVEINNMGDKILQLKQIIQMSNDITSVIYDNFNRNTEYMQDISLNIYDINKRSE